MSCGFSDLVASCYGGRNRLVAEEFTRRQLQGQDASFQDLEDELLHGQKLQGVLTAAEVYQVLEMRALTQEFPLFTTVHRLAIGAARVDDIIKCIQKE